MKQYKLVKLVELVVINQLLRHTSEGCDVQYAKCSVQLYSAKMYKILFYFIL